MFRITEIRTFKKPECIVEAEKSLNHLGLDGIVNSTSPLRRLSRYNSVMKVLKPDQHFKLVSSEFPRGFFHISEVNSLPDINISAIVGENGMGKSSLIDLMLRLINNVAYALRYGLDNYSEYNQRFVRDIYASILFENDNGRYSIVQEDAVISMMNSGRNEIIWKYDFEKRNNANRGFTVRNEDRIEDFCRCCLTTLFYTITVNYSAYGNNILDLMPEYTEHDELEISESEDMIDPDIRIWMHNIFHKNDSYQLPLVLTPFRRKGNINYNNEQALNRDRLCRLAMMEPSPIDDLIEGKTPYSIIFGINDSISPYLYFSQNRVSLLSQKLMEEVQWLIDFKNYDQDTLRALRSKVSTFGFCLIGIWSKVLGIDLEKLADSLNCKSRGDGNRALSYLVYKTIKISGNYLKYNSYTNALREYLEGIINNDEIKCNLRESDLEEYFREMFQRDSSHVTLKLRRILALLLFQHYVTERDKNESGLKAFSKNIQDHLNNQNNIISERTNTYPDKSNLTRTPPTHIWSEDELMPAPSVIADVRFKLKTSDDKVVKSVLAGTLSSGERQMINVLSGIVYHLHNIHSKFFDNAKQTDNELKSSIKYPYVNIIFDEAELYFHPKYQTQFIKATLAAIDGMKISDMIKGINIIIATHSPFILSDIPKCNVLCLEDGKPREGLLEQTFCANVYDILASGFFMKKFVGFFAVEKIKDLINRLDEGYEDEMGSLKKEIELIGDDFIRVDLLRRYNAKCKKKTDLLQERVEIEKRLKEINSLLGEE